MSSLYNTILNSLQIFDDIVWGPPLLTLLVGTGFYLTLRLGFLQVRYLPLALRYLFSSEKTNAGKGDVSSFAALCTALSATVGTGNIVGVATAIKLGGPGALFWMWLAAFFGMATKYAECLLAVKYRTTDAKGDIIGGPMYYLEKGVGSKALAKAFAFSAVAVACFGIGTFPQANAIVEAAQLSFAAPKELSVVILTLLVAVVTLGGIKSIAKVASTIVPVMVVFYVLACLLVLGTHLQAIPTALLLVIKSAFTGHAAAGGFAGASILLALQSGIARGVFSNESGLGSAPIAAAAGRTNSCVHQGLVSMTGTFFDTIIICTMTGLTLIVTGVWAGDLAGAAMTTQAFAQGLGSNFYGPLMVSIGLMLFAFTTIIGWNYYGERCITYLFGVKAILPYKIVFLILIAAGAFMQLDMIWIIADIVNGLMALPNLIGLVILRQTIIAETKNFFQSK